MIGIKSKQQLDVSHCSDAEIDNTTKSKFKGIFLTVQMRRRAAAVLDEIVDGVWGRPDRFKAAMKKSETVGADVLGQWWHFQNFML